MEVLLEPGLQAFACGDEQAAAAGWSKGLGPRVCETGRVYLLRDRAQVGTPSHPGRVLLQVRRNDLVFAVGAPPRCEPRTKRAQICVLGRPHSHPGRVLLRVRGQVWFCCRSTASVRTANRSGHNVAPRAGPIRTRGGCSYMTIHIRRVSYMWRVLAEHANNIKDTHLAQFFADDSQRFGRL